MTNREKRQQVEDRELIPEEVRWRVQAKSDNRCVWCGKKVFLGYEGTLDHFIPLKKGGTNDEVNLVLMCKDCNKKKGSRIYPLNIAATYLNDENKRDLGDYFEDFVQRYDYVSRGNLIASDVYEMIFVPEVLEEAQLRAQRRGKKLNVNVTRSKYLLKRAYPDDQEKIVSYFIKYLKKYNKLSSETAARINIQFWMRFGAIYYVEKSESIAAICCTTVNVHGYISFDVFAYYSNSLAWTMSKGIVDCLGGAILEENDLPYLPLTFNTLVRDELANYEVPGQQDAYSDGTMMCRLAFMFNPNYNNPATSQTAHDKYMKGVQRFANFIDRFDDNIHNDVMLYLYQNGLMDYTWMADELLERDLFDRKYYQDINIYLTNS